LRFVAEIVEGIERKAESKRQTNLQLQLPSLVIFFFNLVGFTEHKGAETHNIGKEEL